VWLAVAAVAAVSLGGLLAQRLLASGARPSASAVVNAALTSASAQPSAEPGPPPVADVTVRLTVDPPEATCEIDGVAAAVTGGQVEIRGQPHSIHRVSVRHGQAVAEGAVVITEAGPIPPRMEVPRTSPAASSTSGPGKPRGSATARPAPLPSAAPAAAPTQAGGDPHMDTKFP
jgi:serine/threonine-protein kinase